MLAEGSCKAFIPELYPLWLYTCFTYIAVCIKIIGGIYIYAYFFLVPSTSVGGHVFLGI